jgi:magnesium-transporting ATPase (P-type)
VLANGKEGPMSRAERERVTTAVESFARRGLRVLALARKAAPSGAEAGRQVYDNVRKFIQYIFAHATPEVVPFLVFALSLAGFFYVLTRAGWNPGDPVGAGHPLHHAYLEATTMTFVGMIAGQIGTAFAVRTRRASLRSIEVFSNLYLISGIASELLLAAIFVYAPPLQSLLGTAGLPLRDLLFLLPYPFIVWGADELRRWLLRRRASAAPGSRATTPATI